MLEFTHFLGAFVQILMMTIALYYVFNFFRGTKSAQMLFAFGVIILCIYLFAKVCKFEVLALLMRNLPIFLIGAAVVIFQPEIRRTLAEIGRRRSGGSDMNTTSKVIEAIQEATAKLSSLHIGALIAIERNISLNEYKVNATPLDAVLAPSLLAQLFWPNSPLHDGGVILQGEKIVAARCVFPLSKTDTLSRGMRHRAAIGLSEDTDAAVVVVSEETGSISLAFGGRLLEDLTPTHLRRSLNVLLPRESLTEAARQAVHANFDAERFFDMMTKDKGESES